MATLTTANSAMTLQAEGVFPVPFSVQGYSTDDSFSTEDVSPVEVQMGVDGHLSAGFVPYPTKMIISLQADSPSIGRFDDIIAVQKADREAVELNGTLLIQGTGEKFAMTRGFLTSLTPISSGKKVLQPRKFEITFQNIDKAPL